MTTTFLHISDFHLNGYRGGSARVRLKDPELFSEVLNAASVAVLRHVAEAFREVNLLFFTGDLFGLRGKASSHAMIVDALRSITRAGTRVIACTGSHDSHDQVGVQAAEPLFAAFFKSKQYRMERVAGVSVWGVGNERSGAAALNVDTTGWERTEPPNVLLAHRAQDVPKEPPFEAAYIGCGHAHTASLDGRVKIPGSVPCFVLSRLVAARPDLRPSKPSATLLQVERAGILYGELDGATCSRLSFHQAECAPVRRAEDVARALTFAAPILLYHRDRCRARP